MGAVFYTESLRISVYPHDHRPVHCHIHHKDWEIKIGHQGGGWKIIDIVRGKPSIAEKREALLLVDKYRHEIGTKWREYHGY